MALYRSSGKASSRVSYWLVFSVLFALLPFWIDSLVKNPDSISSPMSFEPIKNFFLKRELYIVCTALLADAFAGLMQVSEVSLSFEEKPFVNPLRAACFVLAVITTGLYVATPKSALFTAFICLLVLIVGGSSKAVS